VIDVVNDVIAVINEFDEPDLYVTPSTPREIFEQEVKEWQEYKDDNPKLWKTVYKRTVDTETLAFISLSNDTKAKIVN
tara:strand:- start:1586 stop:1819 length:234 start_codon:yes stop_codon:yes gene_type:complete